MQTAIVQLASYKTPPLPTLSSAQAPQAPSPTDAVYVISVARERWVGVGKEGVSLEMVSRKKGVHADCLGRKKGVHAD
jgi:hypothetical protein